MKAKEIFSKYGIVFVLVVMVLLLCIVSPSFRKPSNLMNVLLQACIFGILALGMTLVIIGKGTDLAVGSTLALCAVVCASFGQKATASGKMYPNLPELPIVVPILAALLIGVVVGLVNGSFIAFTGIPAFIATLGMQTIARGFALLYSGGKPVSGLVPAFKTIGSGRVFGFLPVPVLIYIICIAVTWVLLNNTRFGKRVYAIGGNIQAAEVSGINVKKMILLINAYMGLLAGLIGLIPNCAASVIITDLYLQGALSAGAMLSGLLVGAGVGLLVLFRMNRRNHRENLVTLVLLYVSGVLFGLIGSPLF